MTSNLVLVFFILFLVLLPHQITSRIAKLCYGLDPKHIDATIISQKVIQGVYPGVTTMELDELAAQTAASCATKHPDFSTLAARISVSNLHKQTSKVFSDVVEVLRNNVHPTTGQPAPLVSEELYDTVMEVSHKMLFHAPCIALHCTVDELPIRIRWCYLLSCMCP